MVWGIDREVPSSQAVGYRTECWYKHEENPYSMFPNKYGCSIKKMDVSVAVFVNGWEREL